MMEVFSKYLSIGVINTAIHWLVFAVIYAFAPEQSLANVAGFCVAVTFSFFANARWTFNSRATSVRYISFVGFMGLLSWLVGWGADAVKLPPLITLVVFSLISLIVGFVYSRYFVFNGSAK